MNFRLLFKYLGYIILVNGVFMIPAMLISVYNGEHASVYAFAITIILSLVIGFLLTRLKSKSIIQPKESFVIVALGWFVMSFFGALPFILSGCIPHFIDAWFETVSGFTTTGSSILTHVEGLPFGILYWRSFTHWVGGMGVLVFVLAIIPLAQGNGETLYLMRAESPGPAVGKLTPTIRSTSRILYLMYIVLTLIEITFLICGGMPAFDAITNSFATAGTGGFAIKNDSIASYSVYSQVVIGIFMALFGVNFSVYYLILTKQFKEVLYNEEFRTYWGIIITVTLVITFNILPIYQNFGYALKDSFFSVSSVITTTGFATADFDKWPQLSRILLVFLMIIGASAGSTGGGIKVSRVILSFKYLKSSMRSMLRPRRVDYVTMDGKRVEETVIKGTLAFITAYSIICIFSMIIVSFDNFDLETTVTAVFACINNIGPGLALVGPAGNFSGFSDLSKFVLSMDMLIGRLEIFPILFLFYPGTWSQSVKHLQHIKASAEN
jgi:trk system potassium uptake protein TrkH